jgi:hypothetical protein
MSKKILCLLSWLFVIQASAQNLSITNSSGPNSVSGCTPSTNFTFNVNHAPGNFNTSDVVHLDFIFAQGVQLYQVASNAGSITINGNSVTVSNLNGINTFEIQYSINLNCNFPSNNTVLNTHSVNYGLNSNTSQTFNYNSTYACTQSVLVFDGGTNLNFNNALLNTPFARTYIFKNSSNVPFTGNFTFDDNAFDPGNATYNFTGIALVPSVNAGTLVASTSSLNAHIELQITGLVQGQSFTITETGQLLECSGALDHSKTVFTAMYGCHANDQCRDVESSIAKEATARVNQAMPAVQFTNDQHLENCINTPAHRTYTIINVGAGAANKASLMFSRGGLGPIVGNSYFLDGIDPNSMSATINGVPATVSDSTSASDYYFYIHVTGNIEPGDTIIIEYDEVFNCIPEVNYGDYFDKTAILHNLHPFYISLSHPCLGDVGTYPGLFYSHPQELKQTFTNLNGQMLGGPPSSAWFNIDNATPLILGNYHVPANGPATYLVPYNLADAEFEVRLKLETGLRLTNNSDFYLTSQIGATTVTLNPLPGDVNNPNTGQGDIVTAKFHFPANWYNQTTYNGHTYWATTTEFNQFFSSFKVNFQLEANCAYAPSNGVAHITEQCFINPTPACADCKLPLCQVSDFTNINCPGCVVPGWNITSFDIKRTTLGFADTDNNHLLDSQPPVVASINDVNTSAAMIGDIIEGSITGYLSDGQDFGVDSLGNSIPVGFTFANAGFAYDEGLLNFSGSILQHLQFISATGTLTLSDGSQTTFAVTAADIFPQTNCIGIPMSIQDLTGYGALGLSDYSTITNIELHPRFKIIHNLTDGNGNPYYSVRAINCFYYISGSDFTDACGNLQDANYHIPELLAQPEVRPDYQYWCTSYEGRFMGVGVDLKKTYLKAAENTRYNSIPSISLCSKSISYNYWVSVGKEYITDPQSGAMNQTSATIFNNEVRPIGTLDELTFNYPADYEPAAITFHNFDAGYDVSNNVHAWYYDAGHNFDYPVYNNGTPTSSVNIGADFITIYPSQFISTLPVHPPYGTQYYSAFEENQYYMVSIYLRPKDCSDLPELSDFSNNTTEAKFSNYPLNTVTQTTTSIENVDVSGLKNGLSFRNPNPVLSLTTPSGINPSGNLVSWDVALTSNAVDPSPNPLDEAIIRSAENTFVSFVSPSGNFSNMAIGGNVTTFLNANSTQAAPVMIPGWTTDFTNQSAGYNLDFVGYNYNEDQIISKQFKINADFNCANLTPGASDYITVYKGWNCFNAPNSVLSACKHDSVNLYFTVPETEIQVSFQNETTVSACSTTTASITLDPTTGVTQSVVVELQSVPAGAYAYIPNSAYFATDDGNGGTATTYIEPSFSNGVWTWNLNSLGGNFSQAPVLYYQLQTSCGFESGQTIQHVTAKNSCGLVIANLTHTWSPQVILNLPQPDSVQVSVDDITLGSCQNNFSVQLSITNTGTNATGGQNHIIFPLPNGMSYTGSNPDIVLENNELHINVPANINSGNNFTYTIPLSYAASTCTTVPLTFSVTHNTAYSCGNDTCTISSASTVIETATVTVNLPVYTVSAINTGELCNNGNTLYFSLTSTGATITDLTSVSVIDLNTGTVLGSANITLPFINTEAMSVVLTGSSTNLGFAFSGCNCNDTIAYTYSCPCNANAGADVTICEGDTATLTASGGGNYLWMPGNFGTASIDVNPQITTTYTLTVTNGTVSCTDEVTVFIAPTPSLTVTADDSTICKKQSATLTAAMTPGGGTYLWEPLPVSPSANSPVITVNPNSTTVYTVTGTVNGCSSTSTITITVIDYPVLQVSPSGTICEGQNVTLTASGASSYVWSPSSGLSNTVGATVIASPIITTEYLVIGSNEDCSVSTSVIVVVNPLPAITVNSPTICAGESTTLTAGGASDYSWSPTSGLSSITGPTVTTNPTVTTIYTVTGTGANGCSASAVATISVNPLPIVTVNSPTICAGQSVTLTANGANTYTWSPTSGLSSVNGPTVATNPNADMIYTVTGTDANGCRASAVATISVNSLPIVTVNSPTICAGQSVTLTANGANTYTWSPTSGLSSVNGSTVATNPTADMTYTVTGTNANGCISSAVSHITVYALPNVTVNSPTICAGQSVTLTANGASTYSWSPTSGLSSTTGSSVTTNPTADMIYTVTGTAATGCSATAVSHISVNLSPEITITGQDSVCKGQNSTTLYATMNPSGGSFVWTIPPSNTPVSTTSVLTTGLLYSTTVYSVSTTLNGCTTSTTYPVVVVGSISISLTASENKICLGDTLLLTANGAGVNGTYSWDPLPLSVGVNGSPATYLPSQTTTYTVTGTNSIGCVDDNTITVTVRNCLCEGNEVPAIIGTGTETSFVGDVFAINNNTTINANTLFKDASVVFTGDYTLFVNNGVTLTLNHAHLWACETMWNGIKVLPGGRLVVIGNSLIEDADSAIYIKNPALSGGNANVLEVNGATFNKNFTAITIDSYNANASNYPFIIKDAVFTKRDIGFATTPPFTVAGNPWPAISSYKAIVNAGTINEHCMISNYQSISLKAPHIPDNSKYGIRINDIGNLNNNWNAGNTVYKGILIGATGTHGNTNMNLYDNLETGIYAMNSNFTNINSTFQYMVSVNDEPTIHDADGIGIFAFKAKGTDNMYKASIKEGAFFNVPQYINKFYDTRYGVLVNNYAVTEIVNSDVRSTQANDLSNLGTIGFDVVTAKYKSVTISTNTITNVGYGIACTGHQNSVFGPVTIDNNVIQAHYPDLPFLTSQFVRQGIFALTFSIVNPVQSNTIVSTSNNILLDVDNGIVTRQWKALKSVSNSNYIRMVYRPNLSANQIGIEHSDNHANEIINNRIEDDPNNNSLHTVDNYKGIFSGLCMKESVTCNTITRLGNGIEFNFNHSSTVKFNNNTFDNNFKGYVLSNNGDIGNQFNSTSPSDNKWINFDQANFHTFVNSSNPLSSILYVRNMAPYKPTQNGGSTPYSLGTSIINISGNPKELACKPPAAFEGVRIVTFPESSITDQDQFNYSVYPNPAQREVSISTTNLDMAEAWVEITDIAGKHITSKKLHFENGVCRFNLDIENGAYLLNIQGDNGIKSASHKLIIMK